MTRGSTRVVLVSGGSRGLGAHLVEAFLRRGDRVATFSRTSSPEVERWGQGRDTKERFRFEPIDLVDSAAASAFVRRVSKDLGPIDVLVNNAGIAMAGLLALTRDEDVDRTIDLNLKATIRLTRAVVRGMLARRSGRIVNISSIVGLSGYSGLSVYGATKAALDGFTRALARELGPRNITVNSIAPGYLRTEMTHGLAAGQLEQIVRRTPLERLGEPNDVVPLALFLASDESAFVTGQVIAVDGGLTA